MAGSGILEFMARPRSPAGKRVSITIKVSEAQSELINAALGGRERSEWCRDVLLAAAGEQSQAAVNTTAEGSGNPLTAVRRTGVEPGLPPDVIEGTVVPPERKQKNCRHPDFRGVKGVCPDCHELVGYKS
jgi:hypothetical protein